MEPIQQEDSAEEDAEGNPEMDVGDDGAINTALSLSHWERHYCSLAKSAVFILGMDKVGSQQPTRCGVSGDRDGAVLKVYGKLVGRGNGLDALCSGFWRIISW